MFIPVGSNLPYFRLPWVSMSWLLTSILLFCFITLDDFQKLHEIGSTSFAHTQTYHWAVVPAESNPFWKFFTYQFMHASWIHLISNMWYLLLFGWALENAMGSARFSLIALFGGATAIQSEIFFQPHLQMPIVGASGMVAVLMGCFIVLFPQAKVRLLFLLIPLPGTPSSFFLPMRFLVYFWLVLQISGLASHTWVESRPIAYATHLFGFFVGLLLGLSLRFFRKEAAFEDIELSGRMLKMFYTAIEDLKMGRFLPAEEKILKIGSTRPWDFQLQRRLAETAQKYGHIRLADHLYEGLRLKN